MVDRKKLAGALFAGLFLAGGGAAVAISASEDPPPSGQAQEVAQPRSLPPQGPQGVSAFARPAPAAPPETAEILARRGIANPKLAREVGGKRIYLGQMGNGFICMSVAGSEGRVTTACQTPETISQGHLWLGVGGTAESEERIYGVAPDGVSDVLLTQAGGENRDARVVNNIYASPQGSPTARIEWTGGNGAKADLRLPTGATPPLPEGYD